jgi:hypothetical protein
MNNRPVGFRSSETYHPIGMMMMMMIIIIIIIIMKPNFCQKRTFSFALSHIVLWGPEECAGPMRPVSLKFEGDYKHDREEKNGAREHLRHEYLL